MNSPQRLLVIASLVVIGLVLAFVFLQWGDQYSFWNPTKIFVFYEGPTPGYSNLTSKYGIYTKHGIAGVLLGLVAPLCLFAAAAFVYLGSRGGNVATRRKNEEARVWSGRGPLGSPIEH